MSDIVQSLGFDATAALASLSQLDGALATFSGRLAQSATSLRDFNTAGTPASAMLSRLANNATKANATLDSLNAAPATSSLNSLGAASQSASSKFAAASKSMQASSAATAASIGRLTTSTQLLSRIAFTQFAIRGLNTIRTEFEDAAKGAADFEKQIALITTIDNSGTPFETIASNVRNLSDQFNIPLLETAAATYQTLSNQVGDLAQSQEFLTEAAKFARATNSSYKDSVDLLSAAMKSYGLSVHDTDKISTSFFKAIDLGRLDADELANSLGRILPISAALGIGLDENNAALAAISIKGSGTSESITQLRSIITAFLKPSDAMKDALGELGVSSADLLIQEVGLAGALRLVTGTTDGSKQAMAALFQNVRGLAGSVNLTADGMKELAHDIEETEAAGRNFANTKFLQATNTDAEKLTAELNKVKNAFTVDFGRSVIQSGKSFSDLIGGADGALSAVHALTPAVLDLGAGFVTLRTSSLAAAAGLTSLAPILAAVAGGEFARAGGKFLGGIVEEKRSAANLAPIKQLAAANADALKSYKAQLAQATDADNKADQTRLKTALAFTRNLNQTYLQQQSNLANAQKTIDKLQGKAKLTPTQAVQLSQARQTVRNAPNPLAGVPGLSQLAAATGKQITTPDQLSRGLIDAEKRIEQLRSQIDEARAAEQKASLLQGEVNSLLNQIGQKSGVRNSFGGEISNALRQQFSGLDAEFKQTLADGKVTEQELSQLIEKRNEFGKAALDGQNPTLGKLQFSSTIELMDQALTKMQELSKTPNANVAPLQQELQTLDGAMIIFSSQLEAGVSKSAQIASNFERAAQASQQIKVPTGAQAPGFAEGGLVRYLAEGGFAPRGTDTIPAMLSPGEFVVNAKSTRRFYAQLEAINSGRQPIYRADGGSTTVQFGDVNITESKNGQDTARQIMDTIRRQLRRNTGRI